MNNKQLTPGMLISFMSTALLSGLILFSLLGVYGIMSMFCGIPALIFTIVNLFIIIVLASFGKFIIETVSFPSYIQLWTITAFYTVFQFCHLFLASNTWKTATYTLYHLTIVVLWVIIASAIVSIGKKIK